MAEKFSHNMKIIILNYEKDQLYEHCAEILPKVYAEIANKVIRKVEYWSGSAEMEISKVDFAVLWHRKILSDYQKMFIGDLFTTSMVCDALLQSAMRRIIVEIQQKIKLEHPDMDGNWRIVFHISKIAESSIQPDYVPNLTNL